LGGQEHYRIAADGVATWSEVGGVSGTAMTLNATGLGVGGVPSYKLDVQGTSAGVLRLVNILNLSTDPAAVTRLSLDGQGATWHLDNERTNGIFKITRNSTACLTIDNSGNVGVGVSPTYKLDLLSTGYCESRIRSSGNGQQASLRLETKNSDTTDCKILLGCGVNANNQFLIQDTANTKNLYFISGVGNATNSHLWYSGGATATMTLDASGNLLVGKSTAGSLGTVGHELKANGEVFATQSSSNNVATTFHAYSSGAAAYRFYVGMGGTVYATNTTISAISDARLKENVQDIDVGLGAILALKPRKFDWKEGKGKNIKGDRGFIAQEFEQVFPNLIDEWKDNAPEGETPYKSVRQDLIPVLVKAIQELTARVAALEA
jgi:hypothetical protein